MVDFAVVAWGLVSLGLTLGILMKCLPLPAGKGFEWGGHLISYSLVTAAFLGIWTLLQGVSTWLVNNVYPSAGLSIPVKDVNRLPEYYFNLGLRAFTFLSAIAASGFGAALIPIIGPALANIVSVVATVPGLALSITLVTAYTIATFLMIFVTMAPFLLPVGVALIAVPAGKLKGLGGFLIAASLAFTAVSPFIPYLGILACQAGREPCDLGSLTSANPFSNIGQGVVELVHWLLNPVNNEVMKMFRFALGSLIGLTLVGVTASALSRGIGGVAASLGV